MAHQLISRRVLATGTAGAVALCVAAVGAVPASAAPEPGGHARRSRRTGALGRRRPAVDVDAGEGRPALHPERLRLGRDHPRRAQPAAVRRREPGGGGAQVPPRRRHLLRLDRQRQEPGPDRRPLERPAAGRAIGSERPHPAAGRHRPGAGRGDPHRAAGHPVPRVDGARRRRAAPPTPAPPRPITGRELKAMGVNTDFAPGRRRQRQPAQPGDRHAVLLLRPGAGRRAWSRRQVTGYQTDAGVVATAKHFPGHGDTATDSHVGVPVITHTREQWERIDAPPFKAAISAGIDMIMTRAPRGSRRSTTPATRRR